MQRVRRNRGTPTVAYVLGQLDIHLANHPALAAWVAAHRPIVESAARQAVAAHVGPVPHADDGLLCPSGRTVCGPTAPLFDSQGRLYQVHYRVIETADDGSGPVTASNLPGTFAKTPGYPDAFQARDLSSLPEASKIRAIARRLDPDRLLWPHSDATLGAPVVWRGEDGRLYALGGNGRTLGLLMADEERIAAYTARLRQLWPDLAPQRPARPGHRYMLVREVVDADGSPLSEEAAVILAGASQEATSASETPIGRALSVVRGLGITDPSILPPFAWSGPVNAATVGDFQTRNAAFWRALELRMDPAKREAYGKDRLAAELIRQVMVGYLPPAVLRAGFNDLVTEEALMAALPTIVSLHMQVRAGDVKPEWDLLPELPHALEVYRLIKRLKLKQGDAATILAREAKQTALADTALNSGSMLAYYLGWALAKASGLKDPEDITGPFSIYYTAAANDVPQQAGLMFGAAAPTQPSRALAGALGLPYPGRGDVPAGVKQNPRRNPLIAGRPSRKDGKRADKPWWIPAPPQFTPSARAHFEATETRRAQAIAKRVFDGHGTLLGSGNFGSSYRVDANGTPYLVKIGSRESMHSRAGHGKMRGIPEMQRELRHEAGVANELAAAGFRVVPATVYTEVAGRPALVREYGEIGPLSLADIDDLAEQLTEVVRAGWAVRDDLLVGRRSDGSLFVADVGLWRPPSKNADPIKTELAGLYSLLRDLAAAQPWAKGQEIPSKAEIAFEREKFDEWLKFFSPAVQDTVSAQIGARRKSQKLARLETLQALRDATDAAFEADLAESDLQQNPRRNPAEPTFLPLDLALAFEPLMQARRVSEVARGPRGFLTAYFKAKGKPAALGVDRFSGQDWQARRRAFIARHMAQVDRPSDLWEQDGSPSRRHLALIAWAYSPEPGKLKRWLAAHT